MLDSDTSVKHGNYKLFYKSNIIENGFYDHNKKTGKWQFFYLQGVFEYEYDFTNSKLLRVSEGNKRYNKELKITPSLFVGSPLKPYLFIVSNIHYPKEAKEKRIGGKVILALKINRKGELEDMYLYQRLNPLLDDEVMRVARLFPSDWRWFPATRNGVPVNDEYRITIEFDPDDL
ncbi:MAG: energy transducer TonB [Chlorobi bacterium]|nr:energy transducer TonB [Chlorobiota bacterium]